MTKRELLECINSIDDALVIQAEKNIYYDKWKKIAKSASFVAACIIVGFVIGTYVATINRPIMDSVTLSRESESSWEYTFVFDDYTYEIVLNPESIENQGLPEKIEESMLGEVLGRDVVVSPHDKTMEKIDEIYEYNGVSDRSVVIVKEKSGKYYYAIQCNK